jgi:hypothetical protein
MMQLAQWFFEFFRKAKHAQNYCTLCDTRLWPWQSTVRLYALGGTRAHIKCAFYWLRDQDELRRLTDSGESR